MDDANKNDDLQRTEMAQTQSADSQVAPGDGGVAG